MLDSFHPIEIVKDSNIEINNDTYGAGLEATLDFLVFQISGSFDIGFGDTKNIPKNNTLVEVSFKFIFNSLVKT